MSEQSKCGLCGEPMPEGEQMFKYHGLSGPCPRPPLPKGITAADFSNADRYQQLARTTAIYPAEKGPEYVALGLASEAGEVAGKIKKQIRDGHAWNGERREEQRRAILAELGDVLWYAAQLCSEYNVTLSSVMAHNINKLQSRNARGTIAGDGDNR